MITCSECKETKEDHEFYNRVKWQGGKHEWCKECMDYNRWCRKLLQATIPKPETCYICKAKGRRLEVEHDHKKAEIDPLSSLRGFSCHSCNLKGRRVSESSADKVAVGLVGT